MDDWLLIWLVVAAVFAAGEMTSPGSFFLLPFAVGAGAAALGSFVGIGLRAEWFVFLVVSLGVLAAFRPLARRLDRHGEDRGIGARRLIGQSAVVTQAIPQGDLGLARVHREEWRAEALDGTAIPVGAKVRVADLQGTRVIVLLESLEGAEPTDDDPADEPGNAVPPNDSTTDDAPPTAS